MRGVERCFVWLAGAMVAASLLNGCGGGVGEGSERRMTDDGARTLVPPMIRPHARRGRRLDA